MSFIPLNPQTTVSPNTAFTNVAGTLGSYDWCMPVQGTNWKRVVIGLNNYTNAATSAITFPVAFTKTPIVLSNNTGITLASISTTALTIPVSVSGNGVINIEGF